MPGWSLFTWTSAARLLSIYFILSAFIWIMVVDICFFFSFRSVCAQLKKLSVDFFDSGIYRFSQYVYKFLKKAFAYPSSKFKIPNLWVCEPRLKV